MPKGQVSDTFTNITKENYLMQIADYLKVNIKIEAILNMSNEIQFILYHQPDEEGDLDKYTTVSKLATK